MIKIIGIIFASVLFVSPFFGQDAGANNTYSNSWSMVSEGDYVISDSGILDDNAFVFWDGVFYASPFMSNRSYFLPIKDVKSIFPSPQIANKCKYRNKAIWFSQNNKIFKYNTVLHRFEIALKSKLNFETFEIDPNGLILLIGTMPVALNDTNSIHGELKPKDKEVAHFIQAYRENSDSAEFDVEYPDDFWACISRVEGLSGYKKTWAIGSNLIILARDMGFLYNYDTSKHSISKITTPWPCLSEKWLNEPQVLELAKEAKAKGSRIELARNGVPNIIQLIPINGRIFVIHQENLTDPVFVERKSADMRNQGSFRAFFKNVPTFDEHQTEFWGIGELNLSENCISDNRRIPAPSATGPFWMDSLGGLRPLEESLGKSSKDLDQSDAKKKDIKTTTK